MDGVEIILAIEDRYGVTLDDEDGARARTVADVAAMVIERLPATDAPCPTRQRFVDLRQSLIEVTGADRRTIRPRTALATLVPPRGRRARWRQLRTLDAAVPRLETSSLVDQVLLGMTAIACLGWLIAVVLAWSADGVAAALVAGTIIGGGAAALLAATGAILSTRFPPDCATVGDLVRQTTHAIPTAGGRRLIAEGAVMESVRTIIADVLGLPLERVQPEARLIEDLGVD